jgi:two-component system, OmpR family, alkaline phosphatase synthesis response regulator PhoP
MHPDNMMENYQHTVLIVDDEPDILEFISYSLKREGFKVLTAADGRSGVEMVKKGMPDLVLLDVMMPDMDGIEACEQMRNIPGMDSMIICFLTARSEDYSQIAGLEAGGDDYLIKPVKPKVLVSKINALLRHTHRIEGNGPSGRHDADPGKFILDRDRFVLVKGDEEIFLPRKEFELMNLLISRPGKVFTRDEIFKNVWGDDIIVGERTIDVHIRKLREKVGENIIHTIKGVGYKFQD